MKGKAGINEIFSQLLMLLNKSELIWEKWLGLLVTGLQHNLQK
jgi:hypothetical protein